MNFFKIDRLLNKFFLFNYENKKNLIELLLIIYINICIINIFLK